MKWIPTSERLPSERGEYLVTVDFDGDTYVECFHYGKPMMANREVKGECFYDSDDEWGDVVYDKEVIAWMPLPKPYRKTEPQTDDFFREPTAEERKAVAEYIESISVPTGVNIFDLMDEPQTDTEIAKAIVHKMIDDAVIAEDAYPDLRQKMHDAIDEYEPQRGCDADCNEDCTECAKEWQDWKDQMWAEAVIASKTEPQIFICPIQDNYEALIEDEPQTESLEQFRVGLEYHTDTTHFGKTKGESVTTNKIEDEPQTDCSWQKGE